MSKSSKKSKTSKPSKKSNQKTLVTFLLDRSWSMMDIKSTTIEAFNGYLGGLQSEAAGLLEFSLLQFDTHGIQADCIREDIAKVKPLTKESFQPRGGTPLIEAAIKTINAVADSLIKRDDKPKVVVCIQTDGEENSSANSYSWQELRGLIKQKQELGWEFNFMGAGIDAYDQGAKMGLSAANTMSYNSSDLAATKSAFRSRATATAMYASGATQDMSFGFAEKMAAGDIYDPAIKKGQKVGTTTVVKQPITGAPIVTTGFVTTTTNIVNPSLDLSGTPSVITKAGRPSTLNDITL